MISLNLPPFEIKTKQQGNSTLIYDFLRRRFVVLTPEEWVRQHFTHFLVEHLGYPPTLMANEISLSLNGITRRCDTVLYKQNGGTPRIIIEYKAPHIPLTQAVFNQISSYNIVLRADYLIVSNGLQHYCLEMDYVNNSCRFLKEIPKYKELEKNEK